MHHRVLTHNRNHRRKQPTYGIVPLVRVAIGQGALIQQKSLGTHIVLALKLPTAAPPSSEVRIHLSDSCHFNLNFTMLRSISRF